MTNINSTDRLNGASFYVGNDGGAYYLRKDKKRIFWIAEHPGKEYCHIFSGRITGAKIKGNFFSLPKYSSKEFGAATFVIEPDGDIALEDCTVKFPANLLKVQTLTESIKKQLPEPVKEPKWQAKQLGNNRGLFKSDRGVVLYVRQRSKKVWMFGESVPQGSDLSPKYAFMFIGVREGATINGTARSISKGMTSGLGKVTFHIKTDTKLISDGEFKLGGTSWKRRELDYSDEINNYIKKTPVNLKPLGIIERPTNEPKPEGKLKITQSTEGNNLVSCKEQKFLLSKNLSSTTVLQPIKLYPGALVKINKGLAKGDPSIVEELIINPKTFTISEHLGGWTKKNPATFKVNELNRSNLRIEQDAKITWWINNCASKGYFPASDQDTISEYTYNNKAFAIKANINYSSPSFSLSTQVTHKKSVKKVVYNLM